MFEVHRHGPVVQVWYVAQTIEQLGGCKGNASQNCSIFRVPAYGPHCKRTAEHLCEISLIDFKDLLKKKIDRSSLCGK